MNNPYKKPVGGRTHIDVYDVCEIFGVNDPSGATHHAIKKLLCPGQRGVKGYLQDLEEAQDSIIRRIEMVSAAEPDREFPDESRIDAIGQNGNDGHHYSFLGDKWKEAPLWAQWAAMDSDGEWYWFSDEPWIEDELFTADGRCRKFSTDTPSHANWRKSLEPRP